MEHDIETYISAAQQHGEDSEPDHEVGDLQDMLRVVWKLLTPQQKAAFRESEAALSTLEMGGSDYFTDEEEDSEA